MIRKRLNLS